MAMAPLREVLSQDHFKASFSSNRAARSQEVWCRFLVTAPIAVIGLMKWLEGKTLPNLMVHYGWCAWQLRRLCAAITLIPLVRRDWAQKRVFPERTAIKNATHIALLAGLAGLTVTFVSDITRLSFGSRQVWATVGLSGMGIANTLKVVDHVRARTPASKTLMAELEWCFWFGALMEAPLILGPLAYVQRALAPVSTRFRLVDRGFGIWHMGFAAASSWPF